MMLPCNLFPVPNGKIAEDQSSEGHRHCGGDDPPVHGSAVVYNKVAVPENYECRADEPGSETSPFLPEHIRTFPWSPLQTIAAVIRVTQDLTPGRDGRLGIVLEAKQRVSDPLAMYGWAVELND